jgi:hypothetical protein
MQVIGFTGYFSAAWVAPAARRPEPNQTLAMAMDILFMFLFLYLTELDHVRSEKAGASPVCE